MTITHHTLIRIFKFFGLIIICSCIPVKENTIQGKYISKHFSKFERLCRPFDAIVLGMKLDVEIDSTFTFETCGLIATGTWRIKQDSLILTALATRSKADSLQLKNSRFVYVIKKNGELHRVLYNEKKDKILDYLIKLEANAK